MKKINLFLILALCSYSLQASKVTILDRGPKQRQELEKLKFSKTDSNKLNQSKLKANFERDCFSQSYNSNDFDLSVGAILKTFPSELVIEYVKNNSNICPYNAKRAIESLLRKSSENEVNKVAIHYLKNFIDFKKYNWNSEMWAFIPLMRRILNSCSKEATLAYQNIYCAYLKDLTPHRLSEFKESCPKNILVCQ